MSASGGIRLPIRRAAGASGCRGGWSISSFSTLIFGGVVAWVRMNAVPENGPVIFMPLAG
jgi:hypothetical protein